MQQQTMNPWDEIPRRVRPCDSMRSKRESLISPLCRGLHQGQRSCTARKGRTYDRTVPRVKSTENALATRAVPHMNHGDRVPRNALARAPDVAPMGGSGHQPTDNAPRNGRKPPFPGMLHVRKLLIGRRNCGSTPTELCNANPIPPLSRDDSAN